MSNSKGNSIGGDSAGRDINKNNYYNFLSIDSPDFDDFHKKINQRVNGLLSNGIFSYSKDKKVEFNSNDLFDSLMHIAMPSKVVLEVLKQIPDRIESVIEKDSGEFSTRDLRRIIYRILQNLDYQIFGDKVDIWGENYIRKYGNPDVEMVVVLEEENRVKRLNYEFLTDKLIPAVYSKCYERDIDEDLGLIGARTIKSQIASELMEKIRILNLYALRYSTLKKLSYDMAIQPPHPWFTDKINTGKHLAYHKERFEKHYVKFCNQEEILRSSREFIDHSCAAILTNYNLIIGLGKNRPLMTLVNYLKLNDLDRGNLLYWQSLSISNLSGDISKLGYSFYKFKNLIDKINLRVKDPAKNFMELKALFAEMFKLSSLILDRRSQIIELDAANLTIDDLKLNTYALLSFYDKILVKGHFIKFPFIESCIIGLNPFIGLGFVFEDEVYVESLPTQSNSIIIITNKDRCKSSVKDLISDKIINVDFIFILNYDELYMNTSDVNRRIRIEDLLNNSII